MTTTLKSLFNRGDLNTLGAAAKAAQLGTLLAGEGGVRLVRETGLVITSNAAATAYNVDQLVSCTTVTSGTRTRKTPVSNLVTLAATQAKGVDSSAIGTKALSFYASEVADASTCDVTYLTLDPPLDENGVAAIALTAAAPTGLY